MDNANVFLWSLPIQRRTGGPGISVQLSFKGQRSCFSKNTQFVATSVESAGHFLIVVGQLYGLPIILANVYAANWDNHIIFSNFFSKLSNMITHHFILAVDFNYILSLLF